MRRYMKGADRQGAHRNGARATPLGVFAFIFSVLLVLHSIVPLSERVEFRHLERVLNPAGSVTANERVDPWVQPRQTGHTIVSDIRALAADQAWAPDGEPEAVLPASPTLHVSPPRESFYPSIEQRHWPRLIRAFDAQGPPNRI